MTSSERINEAFTLEPQYREYVWGGYRLRPGKQTAEAWVVHEDNRILSGPLSGKTLGEAAADRGERLLGARPFTQTGSRFPLLIKLLDCADWLSLQVHPNNSQAESLEGPGHFGKTEAWHVLEADPKAEILAGFAEGVQPQQVEDAVRNGSILNLAARRAMKTGDTVFIRPGTLHALGPGLLVYEVQQTSNLTYRVYDWGRPASAGRPLHIEQSLAVLDPEASGAPIPQPELTDGGQYGLVTCEYFTLVLISGERVPTRLDTLGQTFHTLTAIEGSAEVTGAGWSKTIRRFETLVVPAAAGAYEVIPQGKTRVLKASVD